MSQCYEKLPHSCGSRDGLQVFIQEDGTVDGHCFACGTPVRHPYGGEKKSDDMLPIVIKTAEQIKEELSDITTCPFLDMPSRGLLEGSFKHFRTRTGLNPADGKTPQLVYFPYTIDGKLSGYKVKTTTLKKNKMWTIGNVRDVDLFGWMQATRMGAKKLIITEGEYDAIAVKQIIDRYQNEQYKDLTPAVVSIPHGAGAAHKDLMRVRDKILNSFKQEDIIFCFDDDKAGHEAVQECMKIFPNAKSVVLPLKDANECLMKGHGKAVFNALLFHSTTPKNSRLVSASSLYEAAKVPTPMGSLTWPWKHLNKVTRNIRTGETYYIASGVKMGKSCVADNMAAHFIKADGVNVLMAKPEEDNVHTTKNVVGVLAEEIFTDPEIEFNHEAFDKGFEYVKDDQLQLLNIYQHLGWQTLKLDIQEAVLRHGCKVVFIDPITNLTNGQSSSDANVALQGIAQELAQMAKDLDIAIFIFCHLKAHEGNIAKERRTKFYNDGRTIGLGNCPHEQGGDILSSQFAGSRAMMRSCHYMFGLEGNKDDELDDEIRKVRHLRLLEDRQFGETGRFPIFYQEETKIYKEM